ncbi:DUF4326 domain-containing protein [Sphingomonas crocodyli]|uniref:DUF4326 domain-containing protein n=1 Tax=Sphingomonas crocodyli TaxID=1979270 RepID=A0A437M828_9SPHN|nr:DUF4326 domain-containing protein [Sphingomonas crocodyli]
MTAPTSAGVAQPVRVQLSRRKGWRMPPNTVKVDRSTRWGNPFVIGGGPMGRHALDHEGAVGFFHAMLSDPELRAAAEYPSDERIRAELAGRNLACWCAGKFCHADALLELANGGSNAG